MGSCCGVVTPNEEDSRLRSDVKPDQKVVEYSSSMADDNTEKTSAGVKRIKVVITKKELQRLLSKQISVEKVIQGIEKRNGGFVVASPRNWKPKLDSILEGNE